MVRFAGFRPSDDECEYGFLVPANMMAVAVLGHMSDMATKLWHNPVLAKKATKLAAEVDRGIREHCVVEHPTFGKIYAYEVDGLGNHLLMDDANVPSLMSIPYIGYEGDPDIYANTRRFILSPENPTYQRGTHHQGGNNPSTEVEGYGSPHAQQQIKNNIWPMSIAMQALTSNNTEEKIRLVETLVKTTGGTGWMHESFDANNPSKFTRKWFCWSDSLFAELVLSLTDECPDPLHKYKVLEWRDPVKVPGGRFASD
jgi:meiotically up-regulated gene 157 (Mug157) protein